MDGSTPRDDPTRPPTVAGRHEGDDDVGGWRSKFSPRKGSWSWDRRGRPRSARRAAKPFVKTGTAVMNPARSTPRWVCRGERRQARPASRANEPSCARCGDRAGACRGVAGSGPRGVHQPPGRQCRPGTAPARQGLAYLPFPMMCRVDNVANRTVTGASTSPGRRVAARQAAQAWP
jgi:hypothetical protein